jgi:hypothetical protein
MVQWLVAAVLLYGGFVALLYCAQRLVQYYPERRRTHPSKAGLPEAEEAMLDTADREQVIVWHVPPREGQSVFCGGRYCEAFPAGPKRVFTLDSNLKSKLVDGN